MVSCRRRVRLFRVKGQEKDELLVSPEVCGKWSCDYCGTRKAAQYERTLQIFIPKYSLYNVLTITTSSDSFRPIRLQLKRIIERHRKAFKKTRKQKAKLVEKLVRENLKHEVERFSHFQSILLVYNAHMSECIIRFGKSKYKELTEKQQEKFKESYTDEIRTLKDLLQSYMNFPTKKPSPLLKKYGFKWTPEDVSFWKREKSKELSFQYWNLVSTELIYTGVKEIASKPHVHIAFNVVFPWSWLRESLEQAFNQKDNWRGALPSTIRYSAIAAKYWGKGASSDAKQCVIDYFRTAYFYDEEVVSPHPSTSRDKVQSSDNTGFPKSDVKQIIYNWQEITFEIFANEFLHEPRLVISPSVATKVAEYVSKYLVKSVQKVRNPILHSRNIPLIIKVQRKECLEPINFEDLPIDQQTILREIHGRLLRSVRIRSDDLLRGLKAIAGEIGHTHRVSQTHLAYQKLKQKKRDMYRLNNKRLFRKWVNSAYQQGIIQLLKHRLEEMKGSSFLRFDTKPTNLLSEFFPSPSDEQLSILQSLETLTDPLMVVHGDPGTGKTQLIIYILERYSGSPSDICIAAFTATAIHIIKDKIRQCLPSHLKHISIGTIHMLGKSDFANNFQLNGNLRRKERFYIIDEASMLNVELFLMFLLAVPDESKILLLGDPAQLPPITGVPLFSIIENQIPFHYLTKNYRITNSSWDSMIRRLKQGDIPIPEEIDVREFVNLFSTEIQEGESIILCNSNQLVSLVNSEFSRRRDFQLRGEKETFAIGDPVIVLHNNYSKGIFNGDRGTITDITGNSKDEGIITVHFPNGRKVSFEKSPLHDETIILSLSYAITIHKAQGNEWDKGFIYIDPSKAKLASREILYVAFTRFKQEARFFCTDLELFFKRFY